MHRLRFVERGGRFKKAIKGLLFFCVVAYIIVLILIFAGGIKPPVPKRNEPTTPVPAATNPWQKSSDSSQTDGK